jgi:hypothetical protein
MGTTDPNAESTGNSNKQEGNRIPGQGYLRIDGIQPGGWNFRGMPQIRDIGHTGMELPGYKIYYLDDRLILIQKSNPDVLGL